jgi:hypothetical protein
MFKIKYSILFSRSQGIKNKIISQVTESLSESYIIDFFVKFYSEKLLSNKYIYLVI